MNPAELRTCRAAPDRAGRRNSVGKVQRTESPRSASEVEQPARMLVDHAAWGCLWSPDRIPASHHRGIPARRKLRLPNSSNRNRADRWGAVGARSDESVPAGIFGEVHMGPVIEPCALHLLIGNVEARADGSGSTPSPARRKVRPTAPVLPGISGWIRMIAVMAALDKDQPTRSSANVPSFSSSSITRILKLGCGKASSDRARGGGWRSCL